ncbi:hypothetical protein DSECCO2_554290 [anaerobic digester metagenome]
MIRNADVVKCKSFVIVETAGTEKYAEPDSRICSQRKHAVLHGNPSVAAIGIGTGPAGSIVGNAVDIVIVVPVGIAVSAQCLP